MTKKNKVLLLGWDGADWKIIGPLLAKGQMPSLQRLIKKGVYGNMSTMNPPYSPMLWSSVATGKTPDKHGVLGFLELQPDQKGIRPVSVESRKSRAIWNILHNQGMKSNLVGWWPSFPAEPINGVVVTDRFQKVNLSPFQKNPIKKGTIHPESKVKDLEDLRLFPHEITEAHILPFIPKAALINQNGSDKSLLNFAKTLAENVSVHCAATNVMRTTEWDFMGVYYDAIDHFCHGFMKFFPPKLNGVPQQKFDIYNEVIDGAYRFQDMMLGRMMDLIDDDTTLMVMSDHGYESGHKRILKMPKYPAAPALEHRQFGIFAACGPDIKVNEKVFGLGLIDVAPTILHMFDLPIGKDMDGKVALDIFKSPSKPKFIESWEDVEGDFGQHENLESDQLAEQETMEQLIELGYIDKPDDKIEVAVLKTKCDLQHNLARVYLGKKDYTSAKEILLELINEEKVIDVIPFYMDLLTISISENEFDLAEKYLGKLRNMNDDFKFNTYFSESKILLGKGKVEEALKVLEVAKDKKPNAEVWYQIGKIYTQLYRYADAKEAFENALNMEHDSAKFHQALAVALVRLGDFEEAADHAFTAIELIKYFPEAHYILGEALEKMGDLENSKKAYEMAKMLRPKASKKAEMAIENIDVKKEALANLESKSTNTYYKDQIVVISGLPRSGTSLMMQMMNNGGLEVLTDNKRESDDSNPKGYFEYEPVMSIHKDNSWVELAKNKSVKVVAPLLKHLPSEFRYKVIFMNRDITEVIKSQQKMIGRDTNTLPVKLFDAFQKQLQVVDSWKDKEPGVELMYVNYKDVLENPEELVKQISEFISVDLDQGAMASSVDKSLYRNKN